MTDYPIRLVQHHIDSDRAWTAEHPTLCTRITRCSATAGSPLEAIRALAIVRREALAIARRFGIPIPEPEPDPRHEVILLEDHSPADEVMARHAIEIARVLGKGPSSPNTAQENVSR